VVGDRWKEAYFALSRRTRHATVALLGQSHVGKSTLFDLLRALHPLAATKNLSEVLPAIAECVRPHTHTHTHHRTRTRTTAHAHAPPHTHTHHRTRTTAHAHAPPHTHHRTRTRTTAHTHELIVRIALGQARESPANTSAGAHTRELLRGAAAPTRAALPSHPRRPSLYRSLSLSLPFLCPLSFSVVDHDV
jgi:ABC-type glutathione transport system ATPase component